MQEEITKEERKQIQLCILRTIHEFCVENGIRYFLAYGTLLGAIRHKGFIPWDDDIDIWLPRDDYNRFLISFNKNREDSIRVIDSSIDKRYYYTFAKVVDSNTILYERIPYAMPLGVYIDLFPLDYCSSSYQKGLKLVRKINPFRWYLGIKSMHLSKKLALWKNGVLIANYIFTFFITRGMLSKFITSRAQKYSGEESKYIGNVTSLIYGDSEVMPIEWFNQNVLLEFEGQKYYAPQHYDDILKQLYGDYMQLPPEEKRKSHHVNKAFWKA